VLALSCKQIVILDFRVLTSAPHIYQKAVDIHETFQNPTGSQNFIITHL